jgi:beta-galactosidase/beta-glucuronidase
MPESGEKKENKKGAFFILLAALALVAAGGGAYLWHLNSLNQMPSLSIQRYSQGGYAFKLNGKPFLVKGFCYNPIPVGKDYEYDFWADPGKPWLTDGKMMKDAGVNAVRIYRTGQQPNFTKKAIHDLYTKFGIRTFVGHYLGFWDWPQANYASGAFQKKMTSEVLNMVRQYKGEPGIIGWILGNENNYSFDRNVNSWSSDEINKLGDPQKMWEARARIYYRFVNDLAVEVKKIDPTRPVIMGIGEIKSLSIAAQETPDIDVLGIIAYRGASFGNLFRQVKQTYDKPVLMTEFGADRFNAYTREEDQQSQTRFIEQQWKDIERNSVTKTGTGNAIGGLVFEWTDEWWKANEGLAHTWSIHDQAAQWSHSSYYYDYEAPGRLNINEEWWGVVSITPKPVEVQDGIDKRTPTRAYFVLKQLWTNESTVVADTGAKVLPGPGATSSSSPVLSSPAPASALSIAPTVSTEPPVVLKSALTLETNPSGGYTWMLNGQPFWAKGIAYSSGPAGDASSAAFWKNSSRPWLKDAALMNQAGVNAIRFYATPDEIPGAVLAVKDFYDKGIYTFIGNDLGFWTRPLADYSDSATRTAITTDVLKMVVAGKNQPGILGWILGNENHSAFEGPATPEKQAQAEAYFSFVNELAMQIKKLDPSRPIIMGLGETQYLELIVKSTPAVDAIGLIAYRGETFGNLFDLYSDSIHKPVLVLEYGADSYNALTAGEDEPAQAKYLTSLWKDLQANTTMENSAGTVVGGFLYEWVDQWWRADANSIENRKVHDTQAQWSSATYKYDYDVPNHLNVNEEWFGLMKLVPDPQNPTQWVTTPKLAFAELSELWKAAPSNSIVRIVRNGSGGAAEPRKEIS